MVNIKHIFTLLLLLMTGSLCLHAQQSDFGWKVGTNGGIFSYYGDLTDKFRLLQPTKKTIKPLENINFESYGWMVEKSLSKSWGLGLAYSKGNFTANDRAIDWNGDLRTDTKNFTRSLNAQTKLKNYSMYFAWYLDNGILFSNKAVVAPYLKVGAGLTRFKVYGDLYTNGQRYYYWPDGTIRNQETGTPGAQIIEQDGDFETNLTDLRTEGKKYKTTILTPTTGIGFKFRFLDRLNLNVEYNFYFTQTDYLDDVAGKFLQDYESPEQEYAANPANIQGEYRGNQDGKNDFYTMASISLQYNFQRKPEAFRAPVIRTGSLPLLAPPVSDKAADATKTDAAPVKKAADKAPARPAVKPEKFRHVEIDSTVEVIDGKTYITVKKVLSVSEVKDEPAFTEGSKTDTLLLEEEEIIEVEMDSAGAESLLPDSMLIHRADSVVEIEVEIVEQDSASFTEREIEDELIVKNEIAVTTDSTEVEQDSTILQKVLTDTLEIVKDTTVKKKVIIQQIEVAPNKTSVKDSSAAVVPQRATVKDSLPAETIVRDTVKVKVVKEEPPAAKAVEKKKSELPATQVPPEVKELRAEVAKLKKDLEAIEPVNEEVKALKAESSETRKQVEQLRSEIARLNEKLNQPNPKYDKEELAQLRQEIQAIKTQLQEPPKTAQPIIIQPQAAPQKAEDIAKDEQYEALKNSMEALQSRLDSMAADTSRTVKPADSSADSLKAVVQQLQQQLAAMEAQRKLEAQKAAELEAARKKQAEEEARQQEIARIQEEAARRHKELEAEKQALQQELARKAAEEKKMQQRLALRQKIDSLGIRKVYFATGSSELGSEGQQTVATVAKLMLLHPELKAILQGFSDPSGNAAKNIRLANQRAEAVRSAFNSLGLKNDRLEITPGQIDRNVKDPKEGRRVEIRLEIVE